MPLTAKAVPILSDNYAWLLTDTATGAVGIVDPADAKACIAAIDAAGGRLDKIIITHHHDDHIAGVDEVRRKYGATVVGAKADAHRCRSWTRRWWRGTAWRWGIAGWW